MSLKIDFGLYTPSDPYYDFERKNIIKPSSVHWFLYSVNDRYLRDYIKQEKIRKPLSLYSLNERTDPKESEELVQYIDLCNTFSRKSIILARKLGATNKEIKQHFNIDLGDITYEEKSHSVFNVKIFDPDKIDEFQSRRSDYINAEINTEGVEEDEYIDFVDVLEVDFVKEYRDKYNSKHVPNSLYEEWILFDDNPSSSMKCINDTERYYKLKDLKTHVYLLTNNGERMRKKIEHAKVKASPYHMLYTTNKSKLSENNSIVLANLDYLYKFTKYFDFNENIFVADLSENLVALVEYLRIKTSKKVNNLFDNELFSRKKPDGTTSLSEFLPVNVHGRDGGKKLLYLNDIVDHIFIKSRKEYCSMVFSNPPTIQNADDFNLEFNNVKPLLDACLIATSTLKQGGVFICKVYDCFSECTIGLLYILSQAFHKFSIVKPKASDPFTSERYVICLDYRDPKNEATRYFERIAFMYEKHNSGDSKKVINSVIPLEYIPDAFIEYLTNRNEEILDTQILNYENILRYLYSDYKTDFKYEELTNKALRLWRIMNNDYSEDNYSASDHKEMDETYNIKTDFLNREFPIVERGTPAQFDFKLHSTFLNVDATKVPVSSVMKRLDNDTMIYDIDNFLALRMNSKMKKMDDTINFVN